jgi:sulfatase modifying factor 1
MKRRVVSFALLIIAMTCSLAEGVSYRFVKVADEDTLSPSGVPFSSFNHFLSISEGKAAFSANWQNLQQRGVFTGGGGPLTTIAKTGDASPIGPLENFRDLSSSDGTTAFVGFTANFATAAVFTGDGGPLTTIAKHGDAAPVATFSSFGDPSISEGTTAFVAAFGNGLTGVFTGSGGPLTPVAQSGDPAPVGTFNQFIGAAHGGGPIAFVARYGDGAGRGVFSKSGAALTTIAKSGDAAPTGVFTDFSSRLSISGSTAAFLAFYNNSTESGVFTGNGGPLTTIVKTGDAAPVGTFSSVGYPATNGSQIAFKASFENYNLDGIFVSSGGVLAEVISEGDSLFGGTIRSLDPDDSRTIAIDDQGNTAFLYRMNDGREGVAIAIPIPEPSTPVFALSVVIVFATLSCRSRKLLARRSAFGAMGVRASISTFVVLVLSRTGYCVSMPTVQVGHPHNVAESQLDGRFGAVNHEYRIAKYEVTNSQYVEFLNAVDATGTNLLGLYNFFMEFDPRSGIAFDESTANGAKYRVVDGRDNKPVVLVSWYDAARFANWMHNGQGTGATETGAYTLLGGTQTPSNGNLVARNAAARWFLPSENEWYKAAYYNAASNTYFDYPTSSDLTPTAESPPGGSNSANFAAEVHNVTDVGAYAASPGPYGTFDQGGNVIEWNETRFSFATSPNQFFRGHRGGSWFSSSFILRATSRGGHNANNERADVGFRLARVVPETSTVVLAAVSAFLGSSARLRKRSR